MVNISEYVLIYSKKRRVESESCHEGKVRDTRYNRYIANFEEPYENWYTIPLLDAFAASVAVPKRN